MVSEVFVHLCRSAVQLSQIWLQVEGARIHRFLDLPAALSEHVEEGTHLVSDVDNGRQASVTTAARLPGQEAWAPHKNDWDELHSPTELLNVPPLAQARIELLQDIDKFYREAVLARRTGDSALLLQASFAVARSSLCPILNGVPEPAVILHLPFSILASLVDPFLLVVHDLVGGPSSHFVGLSSSPAVGQPLCGTTLSVLAFVRLIVSRCCLIILIFISYCEILNSRALSSLQSLQELALVRARIDGNPAQACSRRRLVDSVHCLAQRCHELERTQLVLIRNDRLGKRHLLFLLGLARSCVVASSLLVALHRQIVERARSFLSFPFWLLFGQLSLGCIFDPLLVLLLEIAFLWALLLLQAVDLVVLQERQRFDQVRPRVGLASPALQARRFVDLLDRIVGILVLCTILGGVGTPLVRSLLFVEREGAQRLARQA